MNHRCTTHRRYRQPMCAGASRRPFRRNAVFSIFGTYSTRCREAPNQAGGTMNFLGWQAPALTVACILLFVGAMGKSAQIGLHTWLPDAMEGPTPVSALIHAATMVTAGVFMVARLSPLFEYAPVALALVVAIGGTTALFAATVGVTQTDIKRVIAYSTCSQLGYMFFAAGVSAYSAAIFHLMTHAFFKALLFLGAGSVIHAMSGEQDMRKMGGLWRLIWITYILMWIGSLSLAGIVPFAGYYSKDTILEAAWASGTGVGLYGFALGTFAAFLTAFYSWRLLFLTFHGEPRADHDTMHHVHESPMVMIQPLVVLAAGAVVAGFLGYDLFVGDGREQFWRDSILVLPGHGSLEGAHHVPAWVSDLPLLMALAGIAVAYLAYIYRPGIPRGGGPAVPPALLVPAEQVVLRRALRLHLRAARCWWASGSGAVETARSSTDSARRPSARRRSERRSAPAACRPATSITTPSPC